MRLVAYAEYINFTPDEVPAYAENIRSTPDELFAYAEHMQIHKDTMMMMMMMIMMMMCSIILPLLWASDTYPAVKTLYTYNIYIIDVAQKC